MFCSGHEDLAIELTSTYEVGSKSQTETRKEDKHWGLVDVLFYCFKVLKSCKIRYDKCRSRGFQYRQVASEQEVWVWQVLNVTGLICNSIEKTYFVVNTTQKLVISKYNSNEQSYIFISRFNCGFIYYDFLMFCFKLLTNDKDVYTNNKS